LSLPACQCRVLCRVVHARAIACSNDPLCWFVQVLYHRPPRAPGPPAWAAPACADAAGRTETCAAGHAGRRHFRRSRRRLRAQVRLHASPSTACATKPAASPPWAWASSSARPACTAPAALLRRVHAARPWASGTVQTAAGSLACLSAMRRSWSSLRRPGRTTSGVSSSLMVLPLPLQIAIRNSCSTAGRSLCYCACA
jgi:hypothetical protein